MRSSSVSFTLNLNPGLELVGEPDELRPDLVPLAGGHGLALGRAGEPPFEAVERVDDFPVDPVPGSPSHRSHGGIAFLSATCLARAISSSTVHPAPFTRSARSLSIALSSSSTSFTTVLVGVGATSTGFVNSHLGISSEA